MNFVGTGKRLAPNDIGEAARTLDIETAVLLAFLEVEARGRGFDNRNRPKMLRETHKFYKELGAGEKRDRAVKQGLATAKWVKNYSTDSYPDLEKMIAIDKNAALRSCSWGLPQILGSNCIKAGFANVESMVEAMKQGEREQLLALVTLLQSWKMVPMLKGKDFSKAENWKAVASAYNGPGYAANDYHTNMAKAYLKHKGKTNSPVNGGSVAKIDDTLRFGMRGELVLNLQNDLAALGYEFTKGIDGRFGDETRAHLIAFQRAQKLVPNGEVGADTKAALRKAIDALGAVAEPPPVQSAANTPDEPVAKSSRFWQWITAGGGTAILPMVDWRVQVVIAVAVVAIAIYAIIRLPQFRKRIEDYLA